MVFKRKDKEIDRERILRRSDEQEFRYIDEEVVFLDLNRGEYYGLDKVGTRIWEILEEPHYFNELIGKLLEEYEIDRNTIESQTFEFLSRMLNKNLIRQT